MMYTINDLEDKRYNYSDFCFFWGIGTSPNVQRNENCLSQWWFCDFKEDGLTFCCAEQYMMYSKAILFEDYYYAQKILQSTNPKTIKSYGRRVRDFDSTVWDKHKREIVLKGNILKFSQNADLRKFLLSTDNKIIVEASPYDTIWGVGMKKTDPNIIVPSQWRGINLLGFILMEVRDILRLQ